MASNFQCKYMHSEDDERELAARVAPDDAALGWDAAKCAESYTAPFAIVCELDWRAEWCVATPVPSVMFFCMFCAWWCSDPSAVAGPSFQLLFWLQLLVLVLTPQCPGTQYFVCWCFLVISCVFLYVLKYVRSVWAFKFKTTIQQWSKWWGLKSYDHPIGWGDTVLRSCWFGAGRLTVMHNLISCMCTCTCELLRQLSRSNSTMHT